MGVQTPGGQRNTNSNAGAGAGLVKPKVGLDTPVKSLVAGANITINENADDIEIVATGGGAVDSVFARTGAVAAQTGDYTGAQVANTPAGNIVATNTQAAITELDTEKASVAEAQNVSVSANDTTPGRLINKLVAGTNITITEINDGGNETLSIASTGGGGGGGTNIIYEETLAVATDGISTALSSLTAFDFEITLPDAATGNVLRSIINNENTSALYGSTAIEYDGDGAPVVGFSNPSFNKIGQASVSGPTVVFGKVRIVDLAGTPYVTIRSEMHNYDIDGGSVSIEIWSQSFETSTAAVTNFKLELSSAALFPIGTNFKVIAPFAAASTGLVASVFTVATIPTPTAGQIIMVSDETGGYTMAFGDGTNFRRVQDRAIVS